MEAGRTITSEDTLDLCSTCASLELALFCGMMWAHVVVPSCGLEPDILHQSERDALLEYLNKTPTVRPDRPEGEAKLHPTAAIPWADKAISPTVIFMRRSDQRVVLGLDKPGPELKGTKRGGDWDRVVLVHFKGEGPRNVEVRWREDVVREERDLMRGSACSVSFAGGLRARFSMRETMGKAA